MPVVCNVWSTLVFEVQEASERRVDGPSQVMSFPGSDIDASTSASGDEDGNPEDSMAPGGSVFAVLQAYTTHAIAPVVRAYAAARGGDEKVLSPPLEHDTVGILLCLNSTRVSVSSRRRRAKMLS